MSNGSANPAEELVGQTINGRWKITERKNLDGNDTTGGFFSVPYVVTDTTTGDVAFMKVVNLAKALLIYQQQGVSTAEALNRITDNHLFEVDLAEACKLYKLKKVVRVLDHGDGCSARGKASRGPVGPRFFAAALAVATKRSACWRGTLCLMA